MKKKNRFMIIVFLTPALIMFFAIFIYPIIRTLIMSAYNVPHVTADVSTWTFVGIDNFKKLLSVNLFRTSLWNLLRIWLFGGLGVMSIALLFAVIINSGIRFRSFFKAVIYMPNIVSAVALATMWLQYVFNNRFGLFTTFFQKVGWETMANIAWLSPEMKFTSLLIAYSFGMVGYHMLIFSSGIERIPKEMYEASTIDGASKPRQFTTITWPLIKGVLKTNIIMWSISSVGFFVWSQLFSTVTADQQTITPMVYLYLQTFGAGNTITERNAGLGAAVGVLLTIFVVVVFIVTNFVIKNDDLEY
ncbi:MAG: sugar ABC transporter permease [Clostridiales bacterium]|nr:sugar ABC transporter permease [Clostridiales bacterium]